VKGKNITTGNYGYLGTSTEGIYGDSNAGIGVRGNSTTSGNYGYLGGTYGVSGVSPSGTGVRGSSTSNYGNLGTSGQGVVGCAHSLSAIYLHTTMVSATQSASALIMCDLDQQ
jgi:hypothetical protein